MTTTNGEKRAMQSFPYKDAAMELKRFYIFGQGISFSMSPTIHIAGFRYHGLPHTYEIHQTKTVNELSSIVSSQSFGGASVTMPHKLAIGKYCSKITEHARIIGAVNTLIREDGIGNRLKGDNTDWSGLVEVLKQKSSYGSASPGTGLVIGAGGASRAALYAMYQMGLKTIYLFNRTRLRAEDIAHDFAHLFDTTILDSLEDISRENVATPDVIIGTIPADQTTIDYFPAALFTKAQGICIDMSYKPRHTPLLATAIRSGHDWATVTGIEVLLEQAFDQFKQWTRKDAPKAVMWEALAARDRQLAADDSLMASIVRKADIK
jgi:shikimate-5-dehydrogenase